MAWKPWYVRMAEMDSAEERREFAKGVFNTNSRPAQNKGVSPLLALMAGFGVGYLATRDKKK
jgi:hypothetical protein